MTTKTNIQKMAVLLLVILSMFSVAFAQGAGSGGGTNFIFNEKGGAITTAELSKPLHGLEQARIVVNSSIAQEQLIRNIERLRERYNQSFEECKSNCQLNITQSQNQTRMSFQKPISFLGLTFQAREAFDIDANGAVLNRDQNFGQFLLNIKFAKIEE